MRNIIQMDCFETILTDRNINMLPKASEYDALHYRQPTRRPVRQQSCPKNQTVEVLFGRNLGREETRSQQNSCHRIRVSKGRLPQDFFGRADLIRINTVDVNRHQNSEYASLDTPTFASRAEKLNHKSLIDTTDDLKPFTNVIPTNHARRKHCFFNAQSQGRLPSQDLNSNKNTGIIGAPIGISYADIKFTDKRIYPQQSTMQVQKYAETLENTYHSKILHDQTSDTVSGTINDSKHQSAPECQKNKPRKEALKQRFRNFFLNDTVDLQSQLLNKQPKYIESYPQKRKRIRETGIRDELFEVPALKFPQSDKNRQFNNFNYVKSSMLPPLHQK